MPHDFTCPHCGEETNVADQYAGQSGPCVRCGQPITIPPLPTGQKSVHGKARPVVLLLVILLVVGVPALGIYAALSLSTRGMARKAAQRAQCGNNLKQLGASLVTFHNAKGHFPAQADPAHPNAPPCSWRVQILPNLEGNRRRWDQYDASQPWNSPQNGKMADPMPGVYRCPSNPVQDATDTDYLAVVGPNAVFRDVGSTKMGDITDGRSHTIMLVESHQSGIPWMEPRDLKADDVALGVNSNIPGGIQSDHGDGANLLLADGSVRFVTQQVDPEVLKTMTTINGKEPVDPYLWFQ